MNSNIFNQVVRRSLSLDYSVSHRIVFPCRPKEYSIVIATCNFKVSNYTKAGSFAHCDDVGGSDRVGQETRNDSPIIRGRLYRYVITNNVPPE
jgi:hypothetical protein